MNPFTATGNAVTSVMNSVVTATGLIERTLNLAGNEITALEQAQLIRLDEIKDERDLLQAERQAKREARNNQ